MECHAIGYFHCAARQKRGLTRSCLVSPGSSTGKGECDEPVLNLRGAKPPQGSC